MALFAKKTPFATQTPTDPWVWFGLFALIFVGLFFIPNTPLTQMLLYPLRIFATLIHEGGHALSTFITGGSVNTLVLEPSGGGHVIHSGGWGPLVSSMGYLGTATMCAVLLRLLTSGTHPVALVVALFAFCVPCFWWAIGFNLQSLFTLAWILGFTVVLLLTSLKAPFLSGALVALLCASLMHNAVKDLLYLTDISTFFASSATVHTDALNMHNATGIPAVFWAWLWLGMALLILAWGLRLTSLISFGQKTPYRFGAPRPWWRRLLGR